MPPRRRPTRRRLAEDVEEREGGLLRLHEVGQEADGAGQALEQRVRTVGLARVALKLLGEDEGGELLRPVQVPLVTGQPVQQQEHIAAAGHTVTDA